MYVYSVQRSLRRTKAGALEAYCDGLRHDSTKDTRSLNGIYFMFELTLTMLHCKFTPYYDFELVFESVPAHDAEEEMAVKLSSLKTPTHKRARSIYQLIPETSDSVSGQQNYSQQVANLLLQCRWIFHTVVVII